MSLTHYLSPKKMKLKVILPCLPTISATCSELGTGTHSVMLADFLFRRSSADSCRKLGRCEEPFSPRGESGSEDKFKDSGNEVVGLMSGSLSLNIVNSRARLNARLSVSMVADVMLSNSLNKFAGIFFTGRVAQIQRTWGEKILVPPRIRGVSLKQNNLLERKWRKEKTLKRYVSKFGKISTEKNRELKYCVEFKQKLQRYKKVWKYKINIKIFLIIQIINSLWFSIMINTLIYS